MDDRTRGILAPEDLERLSEAAWRVRENAWILGNTKVGAAVLTPEGEIFTGCNVEQWYRSHDIHAEVNAIGTMVAAGAQRFTAILIVAQRESFTPCGACLDWIFQFGGAECLVAFQKVRGGPAEVYEAGELMPHYPRS